MKTDPRCKILYLCLQGSSDYRISKDKGSKMLCFTNTEWYEGTMYRINNCFVNLVLLVHFAVLGNFTFNNNALKYCVTLTKSSLLRLSCYFCCFLTLSNKLTSALVKWMTFKIIWLWKWIYIYIYIFPSKLFVCLFRSITKKEGI